MSIVPDQCVCEETNTPQDSKALRLARYLRAFVGLRSTVVRDVAAYETVLWFSDMPQEPECQSPAWHGNAEAGVPWLTVHKQQFPTFPEPPEALLPWIDQEALRRATGEMPLLQPTILTPDLTARGRRRRRSTAHHPGPDSAPRDLLCLRALPPHVGSLFDRVPPPCPHPSGVRRSLPYAHAGA